MRYIDADEALRMMRNSKQDCPLTDDKRGIWDVAHDCTISCVEAAPTADVVEVVRCKDCQRKQIDAFGRTVCVRNGQMNEIKDNDYCSYGERSEK